MRSPSSQCENAGRLGLSHLCGSFAPSSQAERPAQRAAIVLSPAFCLFSDGNLLLRGRAYFHSVFFFFRSNMARSERSFMSATRPLGDPPMTPFDSPCLPLTCLIKCFLGSLAFISHIHQAKSPLEGFDTNGGLGPSVKKQS